MLKHDQIEEQAAKVRVTPEELAAAISRLEARKDADERQVDGTIPIGEAVQQLGLEATPEEILDEVRAARASKPKRRLGLRDRLGVAALVVLSLLGGEAVYSFYGPPWAWISRPADQTQAVTFTPAPVDTPGHIQLDPSLIQLNPSLLVGNASGKLVLLSEVGDDQPVHCGYGGGAFQQYSPSASTAWTLIKHNGQVYVRGRTLKMSPKVFSSEGADVTAVDTDPGFVVPVTLPLNGFQVRPNAGNDIEFHAVNIHLDKHAYEKWQP